MYPDRMPQLELDTPEQQHKFIGVCAEFIPYIGDCMGMSPGVEHFLVPASFYRTLAEKAPGPRGSMYPRGSQMFDDLGALGELHSKLLDVMEGIEAA